MTGQSFVQVDAFSDTPFSGNSAAVLLLPQARDARWMQLVAREMNLAETAFLVRCNGAFDLRWFTPTTEVDLCGHATLAAAHALWEADELDADAAAHFDTRSGRLSAVRDGDWIQLDLPALPAEPCEPPAGLAELLGAPVRATGRNALGYLVAELADADRVRSLVPDVAAIATLPGTGLVVTARSDDAQFDFISRFFAPSLGVPEDPVTGSAHCSLGPWWAERLGRTTLAGHQASARGGEVRIRVNGTRVVLGGQAVTVMRGELLTT